MDKQASLCCRLIVSFPHMTPLMEQSRGVYDSIPGHRHQVPKDKVFGVIVRFPAESHQNGSMTLAHGTAGANFAS